VCAAVAMWWAMGAAIGAEPEPPPPEPPAKAAVVKAEFGRGVEITAADDSFSLQVRGRIQVRATETLAAESRDVPLEPITDVAIRRARLTFSGHALTKDLTYNIQLGFSNQDTESDLRLPLRDATLNYAAFRDLEVRVGQGKVQFGRQRVTSSGTFELVDRAIPVTELNLDRDVGLTLHSKDLGGVGGRFGYAVGVYGGDGRNRLATAGGVLLVARAVLRPMGGFDDLPDGDLERLPKARLALGVSGGTNRDTPRERSTVGTPYVAATFDYQHAAADAVFKWRGLAVSSEYLLRRADRASMTIDGLQEYSRSAVGGFVQASMMLTEKLQVAGRVSDLRPLPPTDPELLHQRELGGGASWYFDGHLLKLQADCFRITTPEVPTLPATLQVRSQVQLWF
jgi:phosphate-selective porin OprO and OprP